MRRTWLPATSHSATSGPPGQAVTSASASTAAAPAAARRAARMTARRTTRRAARMAAADDAAAHHFAIRHELRMLTFELGEGQTRHMHPPSLYLTVGAAGRFPGARPQVADSPLTPVASIAHPGSRPDVFGEIRLRIEHFGEFRPYVSRAGQPRRERAHGYRPVSPGAACYAGACVDLLAGQIRQCGCLEPASRVPPGDGRGANRADRKG
jgi:hypothetical protein